MKTRHLSWKRLLAIILALILVVQIMPMNALATELQNANAIENSIATEEAAYSIEELDTEKTILAEDTDKRESDVKHFLNTDGTYTAVRYSQPVHYKEAGSDQWIDIDNTLSLTQEADTDIDMYAPSDSPLDIKFEKMYGGSSVVFTSGSHTLSWSYDIPNATIDDPPVVEEQQSQNTAESDTEYSAISENTVSADGNVSADSSVTSGITAQKLEQFDVSDNAKTGNAKFTELDKIADGIVYSDVYPNVDLEYILDSVYLKENIVLKNSSARSEYIIVYNTGSLVAEQISNKEIALKTASGESVFTISAPYMIDADDAVSEAVELSIISQSEGIVKVKLSADKDWLADKNRVYPVKIDPYVWESVRSFDQDATAIYKSGSSYPYGTLVVGNDNGATYGKTKVYVKFTLPTLAAGDIVTGAYLNIAQYEGTYGYQHVENPTLKINAYKVTSSWSESTIRNSSSYSGLPSNSSTIIDYQDVGSRAEPGFVTFNISKVVKGWYDGEANYGICLRANNESAWAQAKFIASNNTAYVGARPTLQINYRNSKGLESYWTVHSHSAGESGTGYVNDYNGNLVFVAPIASTTGNKMPVSLSLIYNGYQAGSNVDRTNTVGKGWRLNIQEKLTPITDSGGLNSKLYEQGFRYAYDDADGTTHYFRTDSDNSGKFVDEDGMGLTLTVNSTVTDSEKYTVEADTGGKMTFMPSGQLRKVYDDNGNFYKIFYDDSTLRIIRIEDGAGRTITINSDSNGRITSITDPAGRIVTFVYSSDWDGLRRIDYPDGTKTQFYYTDSGAKLCDVYAINGNRIHYEYPTTGDSAAKGRVTGIAEYDSTGAAGNSLTISYAGMNRTRFTDNYGRSETCQFDNWGKTVGILDAAGNGSQYSYSNTADKTANALKSTGVATKFADNRLINHNFESNLSSWDYLSDKASTDSAHYYYGTKSGKLVPEGYVSQMVSKDPNYTYYTSSVYARGSSNASRLRLSIYFYDADGTYLSSKWSEQDLQANAWDRKQFTFTLPEDAASFRVRYVNCGSDNVWIDCAQLENGAAMSAYNMVQNGGFENTASSVWEAINCSGVDGYYTGGTYGRHFYMVGSGDTGKRLVQKIYINRPASKVFLSVSGYSYANSVPMDENKTRRFALSVVFHCTDGTETYEYIPFNPDYSGGWQYTSGTVGVKNPGSKVVDYVYIRCCYYNNANGANFDRIQVNIDEHGTSYTYDDDGNLISAKDNAGRHETYGYNSANDMTSLTTTDNKAYNFTYYDNNKHRLLSAVSVSSGVKNSFAYDDYGNLTETTVQKSDDTGRYIWQSSEYAYNGNYLYKSFNDRGYETTYNYNNTKGTLSSVTDPNGCTTSYEYDPNNDRMTTVSSDSSEVSYGYNNVGRLTSITSPSTNYTFGYDTWGNNTTVSIGNRTLVTNSYAANNGNLQSSRYGGENDGFTIGYSYDSLDRPTAKKYNGTAYFTWRYNADGNVAGYSDNILDKTYTYTYDSLGRLLQAGCSDGSYIRTSYNDLDRSTSLHYKYGGQKRDVYFGYSSKDNLPEYVKFGTGSAYQVTNAYDTLTRLYQKTYAVTGEGAEDVRADYSYINLDASRTTGVVRGIDYTYSFTSGSADLITYDRYYTYDESGNILTESVWMSGDTPNVLRENYTYDGKNQLTRHDSVSQGKSFKYYYDAAGNITSKKEYAYTTGELDETTATTVSYTYGDESWGDLLTKYDGQAITYDTIGNPTGYLGWSFDWTGRSLTGATKDSQTLSFTYNSDGIRTSKTVNGTKTEYLLNGTQILAQKTGSNTLCFFYDQQGNRVGMADSSNHIYYYLYNLQGDVIALADATTGKLAATYSYDAWGKCVSVRNADGYTIGTANPFRYRGYYYDNETGFYYLNSRYYNPEVGRFLNADAFASTDISDVLSTNMFAYCENNPVIFYDNGGTYSFLCTELGGNPATADKFKKEPKRTTQSAKSEIVHEDHSVKIIINDDLAMAGFAASMSLYTGTVAIAGVAVTSAFVAAVPATAGGALACSYAVLDTIAATGIGTVMNVTTLIDAFACYNTNGSVTVELYLPDSSEEAVEWLKDGAIRIVRPE